MPQKRLIILDLNGTILHRLTRLSEVSSFRNHPVVSAKNLRPNITINGSKIVFRPHIRTFLEHILKYFDVAVWTSSTPKNALPMVYQSFNNLLDLSGILQEAKSHGLSTRQILLGPSEKAAEVLKKTLIDKTQGKPNLRFIWTQKDCDVIYPEKIVHETDQRPKFVKPLMKKNLAKVYSLFSEYSSENTLMIDDTNEKLADHFGNHLKIKEFNVTDRETDFTADKSLLSLIKYLDRLVKEDPVDLRTFVSQNRIKDF